MKLNPGFAFRPLPSIKKRPRFSSIHPGSPLGPLRDLPGTWTGRGFNVIWRPHHDRRHHRFLALNLFDETLQFEEAKGQIANRGLLQRDIYIFGVTYLQKAKDRHTNAGLHIETGIWATVPKTTNPAEPPTVVRIASIPHGAAMLAQGAPRHTKGPPKIPDADITPFVIEHPKMQIPFPEANLAVPSKLRSPTPDIRGVTQAMVHNPNSLLVSALS